MFLARFSGAEVLSVSTVAVQGRAVVMAVSQLPRGCALCAKKFALLGLMVGVSAKKFALCGLMCGCARKSSPCVLKMAQNGRFMACRASFLAGERERARCWALFFAELLRNGRVGRSLSRGRAHWSAAAGSCGLDGGCTTPPRSRACVGTYM